VGQLAGVLFQVDAGQPTPPAARAVLLRRDLEPAAGAERQVILADLIVLGQVGIIVVLAVPLGERRDLGMERDGGLQSQFERLPGIPSETGSVWVLGGSPKSVPQLVNILLSVVSWTWTSRPMMIV
jgi:hypothetical protein